MSTIPRRLTASQLLLILFGAPVSAESAPEDEVTAAEEVGAGSGEASAQVWPGERWLESTPEAHGLDGPRLDELVRSIRAGRSGADVHAFLVLRPTVRHLDQHKKTLALRHLLTMRTDFHERGSDSPLHRMNRLPRV